MFKVLDSENELIMIAPLKTIAKVFGLRKEATDRVLLDLLATPSVCLHLNGRGPAWFYRGTIYLRRHGQ